MFTQVYFFLIKQWNRAWESELGVGGFLGVRSRDSVKNDKLLSPKFDFQIPRFFWVQKFVGMKESVDFLGSKSRESKKLGTWSRKLSQPTPKDQIWKKIAQEIEKNCQFFILWGRNFPLFFWCKSQTNWDISLRLPHILYGSML